MNYSKILVALLSTITLLFASYMNAFAADFKPNKKRGQVYYRMVCTVCHKSTANRAIPPSNWTMQQWRKYFDVNAHDKSGKTNSSVRHYLSKAYRQSIQSENKAAKKFLKLPDGQLYADVHNFVVNGARDSDTPASCN